ncbi:hypothetical protein PCANC_10663, partial [Puccinia coronata f. sp. avenae]
MRTNAPIESYEGIERGSLEDTEQQTLSGEGKFPLEDLADFIYHHEVKLKCTRNSSPLRLLINEVMVPRPKSPPSSPDNCGIDEGTVALPFPGIQAVYPLDDPLHSQSLEFFKKGTGIHDAAELKRHIMEIREQAYKHFPYPCTWGFEFLKGKTLSHPFYAEMKANYHLSGEHQKIFVDLGTFVGTDLRQVVADGANANDVLGIDIHPEWRDLGHQLFKDRDKALPFYLGDIFKATNLNQDPPKEARPVLDLRNLQDLNPLKGRVSFISAHQLFHLFSVEDQVQLAERCGRLLSHEPGASIFGTQLGLPEEKLEDYKLYLHSPK